MVRNCFHFWDILRCVCKITSLDFFQNRRLLVDTIRHLLLNICRYTTFLVNCLNIFLKWPTMISRVVISMADFTITDISIVVKAILYVEIHKSSRHVSDPHRQHLSKLDFFPKKYLVGNQLYLDLPCLTSFWKDSRKSLLSSHLLRKYSFHNLFKEMDFQRSS